MEEKTVLSTILRRYSLRAAQRRDEVRPTADLVLRPKQGVWLHLTRLDS